MPDKRSFKNMRAVAANLPVQYHDGVMVIKGSEIIKQLGSVGKDKEGEKIDSDKWYKVPVQQPVNHYRRIKKLFNSKGYAGVSAYVDEVVQLHAESIVQHQNVMKDFPAMQPMSI